jgi:hypothetical protein
LEGYPGVHDTTFFFAKMAGILSRTTRLAFRIPHLAAVTSRLKSSLVETEQIGKVLVVSIARPEKRNAINIETASELEDCFEQFEIDDSAAVAVLCGKGGHFCSGYDLEELSTRDAEEYLNQLAPPGEGHGPMVGSTLIP